MRDVLIDDDQAVARLRHDIGLVNCVRAAPSGRSISSAAGSKLSARIRGRRADVESGLARFGKRGRRRTLEDRIGRDGEAPPVMPPRRVVTGRNERVVAPPLVAARWPSRTRASFSARDQAAHQAAVAEAHLGLGRMPLTSTSRGSA